MYGEQWYFFNIPCCKNLPQGFVPATHADLMPAGIPAVGRWFVIQSFYTGHFEYYKVKQDINLEEFEPWFEAGKIFIKQTQ